MEQFGVDHLAALDFALELDESWLREKIEELKCESATALMAYICDSAFVETHEKFVHFAKSEFVYDLQVLLWGFRKEMDLFGLQNPKGRLLMTFKAL